ncbi:uncharacterized protein EV422DRAFT_44880 [Fimicolochytrium jonesii]|uniref:uncharacterized protein n=1 Tax=Fimicolochytrium jonesii TaxID=1396493 RepID=UPI0022FDE303|nr:uncharacterized protein EV422DRAFT_44880 [Fimicolochytrium jonesii]KAI8821498.1 hypothetical protein EV422DRAFT_44880 [Fimicolochytrium jonesii]
MGYRIPLKPPQGDSRPTSDTLPTDSLRPPSARRPSQFKKGSSKIDASTPDLPTSDKPAPRPISTVTTRTQPISRDDVDMAFDAMSKDGKRVRREDVSRFVDVFFGIVHGDAGGGGGLASFGLNNNPATPAGGRKEARTVSTSTPGLPVAVERAEAPPPSRGGGGVKVDKADGMKAKAVKLTGTGKEEMTRERLGSLVIGKVPSGGFDEAFHWFEPHTETPSSPPALTESCLRKLAAALSPYGMAHKGDVAALLARFDADGDGVIGLEDFRKMVV